MREADMLLAANPGSFWRRALAALAEAFDPAREADDDTVFQPAPARERAEPRAEADDPLRPTPPRPEENLQ
jgi:hypothetical protein